MVHFLWLQYLTMVYKYFRIMHFVSEITWFDKNTCKLFVLSMSVVCGNNHGTMNDEHFQEI